MTRKLTTPGVDAALLFLGIGLNIFNGFCWAFELLAQGGRGLM